MRHPSTDRPSHEAAWQLLRRPAVAAALIVSLVGCQLVFDALRHGSRLTHYPHEVHLVQEEMECVDCHEYEDVDGLPSFPTRDDCADCHNKPGEDVMLATYFQQDEGRWAHAGRQQDEIHLAHATHTVSGEASCRDCHDDVAASSAIWSDVKMRMADCVDCHRRTFARPEECSTCHKELNRQTPPRTHTVAWRVDHGPRWRAAGDDTTVDQCSLCHTQSSCDHCHLSERPRSHDQNWRRRGHGLLAGMDRSGCAVCHTRDTCDRCHAHERPMSHRGSFGGVLSSHCLSCHLPLGRGDDCSVCHVSTPSHDRAPLQPTNIAHRLATEAQCRDCHTPPPHLDNGDDCRFCHH